MENFINSLPKPLLAAIVIIVGIVAFMLITPPHTVCDTQEAAMRERQIGNIFPSKVKKNVIPPRISRSKEACQLGNSAGSCYEYFMDVKKVADDVAKASTECTQQLYEVAEVSKALNDGIELMVRLAWGLKPPEPTLDRFGWLQESEIAAFCRLKNVYLRARGEEAWVALRHKIATKLPGEEVPAPTDPSQVGLEPRKASELLPEQEIWNRSLFSVRCEAF